jgi:uncharacterized membrane protein (DUF2068 family)
MVPSSPSPSCQATDRYLRWIALYNLIKGSLLCLLAIGILGFLHKDVDAIVGNWMSLLGFNMENRHVIRFLARLDRLTDRQIAEWSGVTFAVAGVFVTQGAGLLLRQQWAKYVTLCVTCSLIPVEIFEIIAHFGWIKVGVLAANLGIVAFLVSSLVCEKKRLQAILVAAPPQPARAAVGCEPV